MKRLALIAALTAASTFATAASATGNNEMAANPNPSELLAELMIEVPAQGIASAQDQGQESLAGGYRYQYRYQYDGYGNYRYQYNYQYWY